MRCGCLLQEVHTEPYEVELLAVAEPADLSNVHRFISPQSAEQRARAAAACWIARLAPLLQAANVRWPVSDAPEKGVSEEQR